jgi:hypothetical protein
VTRGGTDGPASDVAGAPFHMRALDAVLVTAVGATVGEFERARGVAAAVLGRLRAGGATTQTVRRVGACMCVCMRLSACVRARTDAWARIRHFRVRFRRTSCG